jgi:hypothetical protein
MCTDVSVASICILSYTVTQPFSKFVRPQPGKFFFHKTRARSQQIYSSVPFQFFLSSYIKLTYVLIINYGIIIKSIGTLIYRVWHVDRYKITFKSVINHRTNEILQHIVVSSGQHLGLSFSTHSRIFFSSEYFNYETFIN